MEEETMAKLTDIAWNEFEEGGWICPTLGKDGKPDTWRIEAFRAAVDVLKGRSGQTP